ncbi:MAG: GNAT family N-acetyltransferase [Dehalococcoidia bacterium]
MPIELRPATSDHVPEMGRILYEAFYDIATRHGFPPDFPSTEFATQVAGLFVQIEDIYSVAAIDGGAVKGSNHITQFDDVAGVGPITVDVAAQGEGIGRQLMLDVMRNAREAGFEMIRLQQDAFNMQSLALYASVGFDVREPTAVMALSGEAAPAPNIRTATTEDVDAMDAICREVYGISRRNETAAFVGNGFPAVVLDRGGIRGYLIGSMLGHGVAESDDDLVALMTAIGASAANSQGFAPLRNAELYRKALAAGHRNVKVMNLMSAGPYEEPRGAYAPSVLY